MSQVDQRFLLLPHLLLLFFFFFLNPCHLPFPISHNPSDFQGFRTVPCCSCWDIKLPINQRTDPPQNNVGAESPKNGGLSEQMLVTRLAGCFRTPPDLVSSLQPSQGLLKKKKICLRLYSEDSISRKNHSGLPCSTVMPE